MNELTEKIDTLYDKVYDLFEDLEAEKKEASLVWVDKKEVSGSYLEVKIRVVFGIEPIASQWVPFGEDDDWLYGNEGGLCDPPPYETEDAGIKLTAAIDAHRPTPPPPPEGYIYIFAIDPIKYILKGNEYINPDDAMECDYEMDYLIFYCSQYECGDPVDDPDAICLENTEMNFYYINESQVIHNKLRIDYNKPDNWVNVYALIEGIDDTYLQYPRIRHENTLKYAFRLLQPINVFDFQPITNIEE
jgi:hypothetical protein